MMNQFAVISINGGERHLCIIDTSRWDFYMGFYRSIKQLT